MSLGYTQQVIDNFFAQDNVFLEIFFYSKFKFVRLSSINFLSSNNGDSYHFRWSRPEEFL